VDLCNSIGTIIESKEVALDATVYGMSKTHIVVCSEHYVYIWQYKSQTSRLTMFEPSSQVGYRKIGREISWCIDDKPDVNAMYDPRTFDNTKETEDPICGMAVREHLLIVGRESGVLRRFTLPHITEEAKLFWKPVPTLIGINCDCTRLALVDISGVLNLLEINAQGGNVLEFEKKDVWSLLWSDDHPLQLAFMEKSKLTTVTHLTVGPQLSTDSYICAFSNLKVTYCYLDDIMLSPDENLKYDDLFNEH
jgi:WD repeat-containing protein 35